MPLLLGSEGVRVHSGARTWGRARVGVGVHVRTSLFACQARLLALAFGSNAPGAA